MQTVGAESPSLSHAFHWRAALAGAVVAAAISLVLHAFAVAVGLGVSSTAPTWRDSSTALALLSGVYLIVVALLAYGVGGYVAGRLTSSPANLHEDEAEFRDGVHGIAAWAIATIVTAMFAWGVAQTASHLAAPSAGNAGPAASVGGENIIAYDLDRLFRTDQERRGDFDYARAEAARILLTSSGHSGIREEDRNYLASLTARHTGLNEADATARAQEAIASAQQNIALARRSSVIVAFIAGAASLLGLAAAWFSATAAGKHRLDPVSLRLGLRKPTQPSIKA